MHCPRQRIWRFALQLWLAAGPVVNHLMASVVGHIFQAANFFACPKASNAKTGLAINSANVDTR
jgi:hypothetical protein